MTTQRFRQLIICLALATLSLSRVYARGAGDLPPVPKAKPKPAPKPTVPATSKSKSDSKSDPKSATKNTAATATTHNLQREPATIAPVAFSQLTEGNLDPQSSGRLSASSYYDEYTLKATSADLFTIQLQTAHPDLAVQVFDQNRAGLPILKDPRTGEFRLDTPGGTLPGDGEYHVRVIGSIAEAKAGPVPYTLKLNRTGLTEAGYQVRVQQIVSTFNAPATKNVDETIKALEQLTSEDPNRPQAYEYLGMVYLYDRHDLAKAVGLMGQAMKLGGAATFRVAYDTQWRRPVRRAGENFVFEDPRVSWLKLQPGQITLLDPTDAQRTVFSHSGKQIKEINRVGATPLIMVRAIGTRKPYFFGPSSKDQGEAEVIVNMIKDYVLQKGE